MFWVDTIFNGVKYLKIVLAYKIYKILKFNNFNQSSILHLHFQARLNAKMLAPDYIRFEESVASSQYSKPLNSLTTSMKFMEDKRKKYSIHLICLIVILQNVSDFSVSANMVWMASIVGNNSWTWLPCKQTSNTIDNPAISRPSTAEGATATFSYYLLIAIFSIIGGYLGDTKLGRYKTLKLSLVIVILGTALYASLAIVLQANDRSKGFPIESYMGVTAYNTLVYSLLFFSIVICAAGSGIHCANIIPFGVEQFVDVQTEEEDGEQHGQYTKISQAIHLLYFVRNFGCFFTFVAVSSLQEHQWSVGFCMPFICSVISAAPLFLGKKYFVVNVPRTNASSLFVNVIKEGYKLSRVTGIAVDSNLHYLDYARRDYGGNYDREDVNAVKRLLKLIPKLSIYMVYFLLYSQMHTTFYIQGLFMKTPPYFPYAGAEGINNITIMLLIPLVIFKVYPYWRRQYGPLSPILKSQVGFALIALSMVAAGLLEYFRILHSDPTYNEAAKVRLHFYSLLEITVNQSLDFYLRFPQYFLIAISEVFVVIVALKLAYIEAPRQFKSVSMGILYMFNALGTLLAAAVLLLTQLITYYAFHGHGWICQDLNAGHMYYYFYTVCVLMVVNMVVLCFKSDSYELDISI